MLNPKLLLPSLVICPHIFCAQHALTRDIWKTYFYQCTYVYEYLSQCEYLFFLKLSISIVSITVTYYNNEKLCFDAHDISILPDNTIPLLLVGSCFNSNASCGKSLGKLSSNDY